MKHLILTLLAGGSLFAASSEINQYMKTLHNEVQQKDPSFKGFDATRGKTIYFSEHIGKRGKMVSCASCHTKDRTAQGENIFTGKVIEPLSPFANPKRFTKVKKVKKWLRRNFKDVYKREGTAKEKGDVLKYMMQK